MSDWLTRLPSLRDHVASSHIGGNRATPQDGDSFALLRTAIAVINAARVEYPAANWQRGNEIFCSHGEP